jgi:predicted DNA-binding transcriptional regulator
MLTLKLPADLLGRRDIRSSGKLLYGLLLAEGCGMTAVQAACRFGYSGRAMRVAIDSLLRAGLVTRTREELPQHRPGNWRWRYVYYAKEHGE